MGGVQIRRATEEDWQLVRDVRLAALQEAPNAFGSTYERARALDEQAWRGRLRSPDAPTFLALDGEDVVGLDGVFMHRGMPHLVAMWVAPHARGSGIGAALTQAVVDWAATQGAPRILLGVAEDNDRARRLYERLGFEMTGNSEPLDSDPSRLTLEMARRL
jgi:ribosomal protein S18 acetylase RimI-like enzyme